MCKSLLSLFINIGTEKKNDNAKKNFFRSSNKWDAAKDILVNEYKLDVLSYFERKKHQYRYEEVVEIVWYFNLHFAQET